MLVDPIPYSIGGIQPLAKTHLEVLGSNYFKFPTSQNQKKNSWKQAGAELGQAQLKLKLDFTLIFFRFGLIELTGWQHCS